ncbi:MAG: uroporphyrinogen-III C-methyltransferase [Desulfobacterales bacterium]
MKNCEGMKKKTMKGKVYLVGAGPGDPGLLTIKGKECIAAADVIIYDHLASPRLLDHAKKTAKIIYVGKKGGHHILAQEKINAMIVEEARKEKLVVRLKGGDPFIFGRGGEEAEVLVNAGIPFEIVSGVTSAIAAPAYAGIPLTHRKFTATLAFVTGHEAPDKEKSNINWDALAKGIGTIVFLMGVKNLFHIVKELIDHGKPPETRVALVRWGTTANQITVTGTLDTIVEKVKTAGLKPPAVIVVGDVISLRDSIKWFENRPLMGKKIVVTRAGEQASELVKRLSDQGADCLEYPMIKIIPADDFSPLDRAIENIASYNYLVFTSVNGVDFFFERLFEKGKDARCLGHVRTATVGSVTSERLKRFGVNSDIVPASYRAESIIEAFRKERVDGKRILLPKARDARPLLPVELTKLGARVDEIIVYHASPVSDNADALLENLENRSIDLITFTSSSTVKNFKSLLPEEKFEELTKDVAFASIGPVTTDTAEQLGFNVQITAEEYTVAGLCDAILNFFNHT